MFASDRASDKASDRTTECKSKVLYVAKYVWRGSDSPRELPVILPADAASFGDAAGTAHAALTALGFDVVSSRSEFESAPGHVSSCFVLSVELGSMPKMPDSGKGRR